MSGKSFYLSLQELYLLLGQSGMDTFFGFSDRCAAQASETELFRSMHRMTKKGLLHVQDETLCLGEDMREIVQTICRARRCVIVRFSDPLRLPVCFYIADTVVQAELSEMSQKKTVRLTFLDKEAYVQQMQQMLLQAGGASDPVEDADPEWTPTALYLAQQGLQQHAAEAVSLDAVVWTVDYYDIPGQKQTFRCCLLDESLQKMMLYLTPDDARQAVYSGSEVEMLAVQGGKTNA